MGIFQSHFQAATNNYTGHNTIWRRNVTEQRTRQAERRKGEPAHPAEKALWTMIWCDRHGNAICLFVLPYLSSVKKTRYHFEMRKTDHLREGNGMSNEPWSGFRSRWKSSVRQPMTHRLWVVLQKLWIVYCKIETKSLLAPHIFF